MKTPQELLQQALEVGECLLPDVLNTFSNFFEMSGVINKAANTSKAKNKRTEALKDQAGGLF